MKNPEVELKNYLKKLIDRLLYIKSLNYQLKILKRWKLNNRFDIINTGAYFFRLVETSFYRTILIEINILLNDRKRKNLFDWLSKMKKYSNSFVSTIYIPNCSSNGKTKLEKYNEITTKQIKLIESNKDVLGKIKNHRDKVLAHIDSEFFNNPDEIDKIYPLEIKEIDELIDMCCEILKKQYDILFRSDVDINITSSTNVDMVLKYIFAFQKIREDNITKLFLSPQYIFDLLKE